MDHSLQEYQVMWIVGAAERLATLGMFGPDVPLQINADGIEMYLEADEHRHLLFQSDFEVAQLFKLVARTESEKEIDDENMNNMIHLILEYKNNRDKLVKYALSHALA